MKRIALAAALACSFLSTAHAQPAAAITPEAEVLRHQTAVMWMLKSKLRDAQMPRALRREHAAMRACKSKGPGWKRIRKVKSRSQRNAYSRAARQLWAELDELASERARLKVYRPVMTNFIATLDRLGITDPVLVAAIAAQKRRLADQADLVGLATCKTFESRLRKVRGFKGSVAETDARAGKIINGIGRFLDGRRTRGENTWFLQLEAARDRLLALGQKQTDADGFEYALHLGS